MTIHGSSSRKRFQHLHRWSLRRKSQDSPVAASTTRSKLVPAVRSLALLPTSRFTRGGLNSSVTVFLTCSSSMIMQRRRTRSLSLSCLRAPLLMTSARSSASSTQPSSVLPAASNHR